ncbi:MAG: PBP1A family penicillin-binding protein [Acidobacteriia bacterium]|nr:PBP1A family penicillin-binding protein [Terriglobia bacterium]
MSDLIRLPIISIRGKKIVGRIVFGFFLLASIGIGAILGLLFVYMSDLPQVSELENYRPDVISEVYADDGQIIGSFAIERRVIVDYRRIPQVLQDAIISVEDQNFEKHIGVDFRRIISAAWTDLITWKKKEGASTLTQQLTRNLFLTPDKSFKRKFQEILLSIQIERRYTKQQIMTLYVNQVYIGNGLYGFAAGADYFFNKPIEKLTLDEAALLAGLPQRPSATSPIANPKACLTRRNHVLDRMVAENRISRDQAEAAKQLPVVLHLHQPYNALAPNFIEDIRQYLEGRYGAETVHEKGLKVYTTLNVAMQRAAEEALRQGLRDYDKRHGWRGALMNILKEHLGTLETYQHDDWKQPIVAGAILPGLVMDIVARQVVVRMGSYVAHLTAPDFAWTHAAAPAEIFHPGDISLFKVASVDEKTKTVKLSLEQVPKVQAALLALEPQTGEVKAMVGGYDFETSKFNHATQAARQVGSSFKPYVYSTALLEGMKPDDTVLDAPVSFPSGGGLYSPHNYDGKFEGVITLRKALAESRNVPAVRVAAKVGIKNVIETAKKFGITSKMEPYLPTALGAADITLWEQVSAFSTFPNDGVRVQPHEMRRVVSYSGEVLEEDFPAVNEVIPSEVARAMVTMMRGVVEFGTSTRAKILKRPLAGKTGTTNDFTDAWFIGYTPSLVCGVWVGYDEKKTIGDKETGGKAALPIFIQFMQAVYNNKPPEEFFPEETPVLKASASAPAKVETTGTASRNGVDLEAPETKSPGPPPGKMNPKKIPSPPAPPGVNKAPVKKGTAQ